ncbi:invasion associated locus B family protein [Aquabacter sp. CN5-332]|uniref:invasion associated locus B family protein n=1 Tax=Aquabacter sp. CN5-332 TaxID=3156608 RepID=UPI0032B3CF53
MTRDLCAPRTGLLAGLFIAAGIVSAAAQTAAPPAAAPAQQSQPRKPAAPAQAQAPAPAAQKPAPGAQTDGGPSRTSATYDDWVVRCERGDGTGGVKVCEVAQTLQIGNQQQNLVAQVVFGKLKSDTPLRLVLQLPVGVWLPAGATFTAGDNGKAIPASFKFCIQACIADTDLSAQDAAALSTASGSASLVFQDRNQAQITLPISLKGLAAALAARDKL